ncbi:small ribosomal subunit protein uS14m isoform 1-T1 [Dama dama]|uniref:small ribosomal subunit protein uS14m isoform X1 n=1 Tax=Dama dama TaxID=30532 RepID=UPI002A3587D1|nr:small ribosomal subunit protein uS14m isoform X1 [Dama dama]
MAASMLGSLLRIVRQMVPSSASGQVRSYYVNWRMLRDVKRRKMAYEYADERLRINSLRKNTILPKNLQFPRLLYISIFSVKLGQSFGETTEVHACIFQKRNENVILEEVADEEIAALPRDSCPVRIRNRCVMTSRPRGVKRRWRLSRIVFRHLADHGQLSGIQRAIW